MIDKWRSDDAFTTSTSLEKLDMGVKGRGDKRERREQRRRIIITRNAEIPQIRDCRSSLLLS
jgi:hypothetical protein